MESSYNAYGAVKSDAIEHRPRFCSLRLYRSVGSYLATAFNRL